MSCCENILRYITCGYCDFRPLRKHSDPLLDLDSEFNSDSKSASAFFNIKFGTVDTVASSHANRLIAKQTSPTVTGRFSNILIGAKAGAEVERDGQGT